MKLFFALVISMFSTVAQATSLYQVRCSVDINSNGTIVTPTETSIPFENSVSGFADSYVKIPMGPYMLLAGVEMNSPSRSVPMQPTLSMTLYEGDLISGQINYTRLRGMDLENRTIGVPLTLNGFNFLNFTYLEANVSRIDYDCSITKIQ